MDEIYVLDDAEAFMDENMFIPDDYLSGARKQYLYEDLQGLDDGILGDGASVDALLSSTSVKPEGAEKDALKDGQASSDTSSTLAVPSTSSSVQAPPAVPPDSPVKLEVHDSLAQRGDSEECYSEHIDIRLPVQVLRTLLEKRLECDLSDHEIWLQNAEKLSPDRNLVESCRLSKGLVQISMQLLEVGGSSRINIVDVLLPTAEYLDSQRKHRVKLLTKEGFQLEEDVDFIAEMTKRNVPTDVRLWTPEHVRYWLQWAVRKFGVGIMAPEWTSLTGDDLCAMTRDQFKQRVKFDEASIFWTHFDMLRKCGVALRLVVESEPEEEEEEEDEEEPTPVPPPPPVVPPSPVKQEISPPLPVAVVAPMPVAQVPKPIRLHNIKVVAFKQINIPNAMAKKSRILGQKIDVSDRKTGLHLEGIVGNNGQITLWQFLLDLLTDYEFLGVIYFVSDDGKFKLHDPEEVAALWGQRKRKPNMTYEKLSRALRYYYDGDMIAKVPGQRFVYRFICDLKQVLGYSSGEIARQVARCAAMNNVRYPGPIFFEPQPEFDSS